MRKEFTPEYVALAHKATIFHEREVLASSICTCFYCGHQFDLNKEEDPYWLDENNPKGKTLTCPMCCIDCIIGSASGFPVTDPDFIMVCTEAWFGGISRISDGLPVAKIREWNFIEVD